MDARQIRDRISGLARLLRQQGPPPPAERARRLKMLLKVFRVRSDAAEEALREDSGRSEPEVLFSELLPLARDLRWFAANVKRWSAPRRGGLSLFNFPGRAYTFREPLGVVLITAPSDLPLLRTLHMTAGAYAAGNKVVLKLSRNARRSMRFIRWFLEECFSPEEVLVVDEELSAQELYTLPFDRIFPAGGPPLPPVGGALPGPETAGKSPCIVHHTADPVNAAQRICRAKFFNAGAWSGAPECLLVGKNIRDAFMSAVRECLLTFYGEDPLKTLQGLPDEESYRRAVRLAARGRLLAGGERDPGRRVMGPTFIDRLEPEDPLWHEVIAGPVLPVMEFTSDAELFTILGKMPPAPALYFFGDSPELRQELLRLFPADCAVFNDAGTQLFNRTLPLNCGGDGINLHASYTLEAFSKPKQVMDRSELFNFRGLFPPYSQRAARLLAKLHGLKLKKQM